MKPLSILLRHVLQGEHRHVTVFCGPDREHRANVGTLVMRDDEFEVFQSALERGARAHRISADLPDVRVDEEVTVGGRPDWMDERPPVGAAVQADRDEGDRERKRTALHGPF